jgi:hypothetical protein
VGFYFSSAAKFQGSAVLKMVDGHEQTSRIDKSLPDHLLDS